jgi:hypothetical protein
LSGCVADAFEDGPKEQEKKINEIIDVFDKLNK